MSALEAALGRVHDALTAGGVPYMVIGGIAVAHGGVPRATLDVDVTVWVGGQGRKRERAGAPRRPPARGTRRKIRYLSGTAL